MHRSRDESEGWLAGEGTADAHIGPDAGAALLVLMVGSEDEFRQRTADRLMQLPTYRAVPADRFAGIVDEITWVYHTFLGCLSQRRELSPPEIANLEAIGRSRARQGISIAELHSAFQAVLDDSLIMLEDHARGLAAHDPQALEVVPEFNRTLTRFALQATEAMGRGHARPDPRAAFPSGDAWIQHVLSARSSAVANEVGGGLPDLAIVLPAGPDAGLAALVHQLADAFDAAHVGPIFSAPVPHAVALIGHGLGHTEAASCYDQIARRHHSVVVHGAIPHPDRIVECYRVMRPHLGAVARALPRPGAVALDDVMLLVLLSAVPDELAAVFTWHLLGPLLAEARHDPLLRTLKVYLSTNGTVEQTARILEVTPKTVRARLDRISRAIGRPLHRGDALPPARTALALLSIHRDTWPPAGDPRWHTEPTAQ